MKVKEIYIMIKVTKVESKGVVTLFFESSNSSDKDEIDTLDSILEFVVGSGFKRGEYLESGVLAISKKIE